MKTTFAVILAGVASIGCTPDAAPTPGPRGTVSVAFVLDSGLVVTSVSYLLLSLTNPELQGTIDLPDGSGPLSFLLAVPPATGDTMAVSVLIANGEVCVGDSSSFDVVAGQETTVQIALDICAGPPSPGTLEVTATVCQGFESVVVAPAETAVSSSVGVSATSSDPMASEDFTFSWSPARNFANPNSLQTTYTCTEPGLQTVTLSGRQGCLRLPSGQIVCPNCQPQESLTVLCDVDPAPPPDDPSCQPILEEGSDTGFDRCGGGGTRRRAAIACPGPMSTTNQATCLRDADCGAGRLCDCVDGEVCVPASCVTDADCGAGLHCLLTEQPDPSMGLCGVDVSYACATPTDQCEGSLDCGAQFSGNACLLVGGSRVCVFCQP